MRSFRKTNVLLKVISKELYDLPCPPNLSVYWNMGSLLSVCLFSQIVSGLLLVAHYTPSSEFAFSSIIHIMRDVNSGWLIRLIHANGASFFFVFMYTHIGRGMYYGSYANRAGWNIGVLMFLLSMAIAFLGYVLPWGQMSYWGASVITNMFTAIPYVGDKMVLWLWGGYTVCEATLKRFFMLHFLLPFMLLIFMVIHIIFLHESGGSNPLGVNSMGSSVPFHPYYTWKDLTGVVFASLLLMGVCCFWSFGLMDPTNFMEANSMVTPSHIQPEWYFLFAYSILRAIPNKTGGVVALVLSVLILFYVPYSHSGKFRGLAYYPINQFFFWVFVVNFIFLGWLGSCPVEEPFVYAGQVSSVIYFSYFFVAPPFMQYQDWALDDKGWLSSLEKIRDPLYLVKKFKLVKTKGFNSGVSIL